MYNMPRAATVQAASEADGGQGMLWAMDRQTFRRIVLRNAFQKRKMYESLLESVPLLSALNVSFKAHTARAAAGHHSMPPFPGRQQFPHVTLNVTVGTAASVHKYTFFGQ